MESKKITTLKKNADFLNLRKKGRKFSASEWLLINYTRTNSKQSRIGITLSRKIGNSVTRNKLRRWCKEYFRNRRFNEGEPQLDFNIIFKPQKNADFFKEIKHKDLVCVLSKFYEYIKK